MTEVMRSFFRFAVGLRSRVGGIPGDGASRFQSRPNRDSIEA